MQKRSGDLSSQVFGFVEDLNLKTSANGDSPGVVDVLERLTAGETLT